MANKAQTVDATSTTDYPSSAGVAQYVSSAVATATATFLGNFTLAELGLTYPATEQQITAALASHTWPAGTTVDNNDYVYVEIQNPQTTGVDDSVQRFKYNGTVWAYEYTLNNSSFTSGEVDALESGINATKVGNYDSHIADTTIHVTSSDKTTWNAKQDAISDLETIRTGAGLGATAVQPGDLATVATSGSYTDLSNTPTIPSGAQLLPSATSADEGKFLLVDENGLPEWSDLSDGSSYSIANGTVAFTPGQYYTDGRVTLSNIRSNGIDYAYNHDGWVLEQDHTYVIAFNIVAFVGYPEPGNITGRVWLDGFQETDQVWKFSLDTAASHDESLVGSAIVCPQSTGEVHLNIRFDSNQLAHIPSASVNKAEIVDVTARVNGSGASTYSAGAGLNLTGTTFSVDTTTIATKSDLSAYTPTANLATVATTGAYSDLVGTPTINNVPAVTSSDDDKVLKATYSGGVGSYSWEQDSSVTTHTIVVTDGNPYGLPSKTMRVQFNNQNYAPTSDLSSSDFSCTQVSSSPNVWDITFLQTWSFGNRITYDSCGGFSVLDFNVYGVNSMEGMFYDCTGITSLTILNATGVQNMEGICRWCSNLGTVNISGVGSVKTLADAFYYCRSPLTVNITGLTNVENMYNMFGVSGLTAFPDWANETFGRLSQVSGIFGQCRDVQSGIQDMYTKLSSIPTIGSDKHNDAFYECGANGPAASELYNIPSSWGGRA